MEPQSVMRFPKVVISKHVHHYGNRGHWYLWIKKNQTWGDVLDVWANMCLVHFGRSSHWNNKWVGGKRLRARDAKHFIPECKLDHLFCELPVAGIKVGTDFILPVTKLANWSKDDFIALLKPDADDEDYGDSWYGMHETRLQTGIPWVGKFGAKTVGKYEFRYYQNKTAVFKSATFDVK